MFIIVNMYKIYLYVYEIWRKTITSEGMIVRQEWSNIAL